MNVLTEGLEGKVAIVTGAASGIGRETALEFCESGVKVVIADIDEKKSRETLDLIKKRKGEAIYVPCDVSKISDIDTLLSRTLSEYNKIDILINNCVYFIVSTILDTSEEEWNRSIDVNLKGTFFMCRAVIPSMLKQKGGKIINVASMLSFQGGILVPSYTASKSAVMGLTRLLANELAPQNINVNAIAPGYMATDNTKPLREDAVRNKAILDRIPAGRWGEPEDLQGVAVFLASSASDYLNGYTIAVDGGWLAR